MALLTDDDLRARVLYRDAHLIVLDKPAGLPVHAGPRTGDDLERHLAALAFGFRRSPAPVHRLDADTSGCLVLARHPRAAKRLGQLFAAGAVKKVYWAVVDGMPPAEGRVERALRKVSGKDGWRMVAGDRGQPARTDYRVLGAARGRSWLELRPHTGRTHQIRVHCAVLGTPVLGDPVYGRAACGLPLHLHAREVTIPYAPTRAPITAAAPPPEHMLAALTACGYAPS